MFKEQKDSKLRILQVAPEFPPYSLGGGGLLVMNLSRELVNQGHEVEVLAGYYPSTSIFEQPFKTQSGLASVDWLPLLPSLNTGFQLKTIMPPNLWSVVKLVACLRRRNFDVVHLHGFGHLFCDLAAVLCKFFGLGYILTVHGFPKEPSRRGGLLGLMFTAYSISVGSLVVRFAHRVVAVSKSLGEECVQYVPKDRIQVVWNAVDLAQYLSCPVGRVGAVRSKYHLDGKKVLLCIGRLSEAKGFQFALRSLRRFKAAVPGAHIVIIGKDEGYGYLKELKRVATEEDVESAVSFVGGVSDEEKVAFLWLADVVLIPSIEEVFGIVALEALAAGSPIVASDLGGLKEILSGDRYSVFVKSKDVEGFAAATIRVLGNRKIAEAARADRLLRIRNFGLSEMASKYVDLYLSLEKNRPSVVRGGVAFGDGGA